MNNTYINYIDQLLDLAKLNDTFGLSSRAFNEFEADVLEALKKQIPKNPTVRFYPDGSFESTCPNCREVVEEGLFIYCPNCGQVIDWSEE